MCPQKKNIITQRIFLWNFLRLVAQYDSDGQRQINFENPPDEWIFEYGQQTSGKLAREEQKKNQAHTEKKDPTFCDINYMNKSSWLITYIHNKLKLSRHACRFVKLTQTLKSTKCVVHTLLNVCVCSIFRHHYFASFSSVFLILVVTRSFSLSLSLNILLLMVLLLYAACKEKLLFKSFNKR